jgi:hypothetical protein
MELFRVNETKKTAEEGEFGVWLDKTKHHLECNESLDLPIIKMHHVYVTRFKIVIYDRQDILRFGFEKRELIKFLDSNKWIRESEMLGII